MKILLDVDFLDMGMVRVLLFSFNYFIFMRKKRINLIPLTASDTYVFLVCVLFAVKC